MASVKKNYIFDVLNNVSGLLFPIITFPYVSRILSPEGIGQVAFVQSIISYLVMFAALGIPTYALREVAKRKKNKKDLSEFTLEILLIHVSLTIIAYLVACSFLFFDRINNIWQLYIIASAHLVLNFLGFGWFYQGIEDFKFITIRVFIFRTLSLISLFLFVHERSDIYWYLSILILSEAGNNLCNIFRLRKYVSLTNVKFCDLKFRHHFKPIISLFILSVSTMIYFNMDNLMIGIIKDDVSVGYYNPSLRIQRMLMGFVLSLSTVLFPRLASLANTDKEKFGLLSKSGFIITLGMSVPIVFGIFALGKPLIYLFAGASFEPSILTLQLLAPVIVFGTCSNIIAKVLISQQRERIVLQATTMGAIVNLLFNGILIYFFSQYGAALASTISEIAVLMSMMFFGRKFIPNGIVDKNIAYYFISALMMFILLSILVHCLNYGLIINCIICGIVGIFTYGIMLILLKEHYLIPQVKSFALSILKK